jgi:hypothetical protein
LAVYIRNGVLRLIGKLYGYFFTRSRRAPDSTRFALLQDGVIREYARRLDRGKGADRAKRCKKNGYETAHDVSFLFLMTSSTLMKPRKKSSK